MLWPLVLEIFRILHRASMPAPFFMEVHYACLIEAAPPERPPIPVYPAEYAGMDVCMYVWMDVWTDVCMHVCP